MSPPRLRWRRSQQCRPCLLSCQRGRTAWTPGTPSPSWSGLSKKEKASSTRGRARGGHCCGAARRLRLTALKRWASSKRRGPLSSRLLQRPLAARQSPGALSQRKRNRSPSSSWLSRAIGSRLGIAMARLSTPSPPSWRSPAWAAVSRSLKRVVTLVGACNRNGPMRLLKCMGLPAPRVASAR